MQLQNSGLVLEGGGLRGIFTSGVLRYFMDRELYFPYVIGVSMGACNAVNYVARQPERNRIVNTRFLKESRYLSYRRLFLGGDLFGMDFIFDTIPNKLVPFDYDTFLASDTRLVIVATDCETGEALYYEKDDLGRDCLTVLRASSSLPFIARPVPFRGRTLMDGGLADSVPLERCLADGIRKAVLVLTREKGYRKKPSRFPGLVSLRYPGLPGLRRALDSRWKLYNAAMDDIDRREEKGEIFVFRPEAALGAARVERDKDKLYETYDAGYDAARKRYADLEGFLSRP